MVVGQFAAGLQVGQDSRPRAVEALGVGTRSLRKILVMCPSTAFQCLPFAGLLIHPGSDDGPNPGAARCERRSEPIRSGRGMPQGACCRARGRHDVTPGPPVNAALLRRQAAPCLARLAGVGPRGAVVSARVPRRRPRRGVPATRGAHAGRLLHAPGAPPSGGRLGRSGNAAPDLESPPGSGP